MKIIFSAILFIGFVSNAFAQVNAQSIRTEIESSVKLSRTSKAQLTTIYTARNFEPIWIDAQGFNQAAKNLRAAVAKINTHGLPVT